MLNPTLAKNGTAVIGKILVPIDTRLSKFSLFLYSALEYRLFALIIREDNSSSLFDNDSHWLDFILHSAGSNIGCKESSLKYPLKFLLFSEKTDDFWLSICIAACIQLVLNEWKSLDSSCNFADFVLYSLASATLIVFPPVIVDLTLQGIKFTSIS